METNDREKLKFILKLGIKHSKEHKLDLEKWAEKMDATDKIIIENIKLAAKSLESIDKYLKKALNELEKVKHQE